MPSPTTLSGRDAIPVEPIRDGLERRTCRSLPTHPLDKRIG